MSIKGENTKTRRLLDKNVSLIQEEKSSWKKTPTFFRFWDKRSSYFPGIMRPRVSASQRPLLLSTIHSLWTIYYMYIRVPGENIRSVVLPVAYFHELVPTTLNISPNVMTSVHLACAWLSASCQLFLAGSSRWFNKHVLFFSDSPRCLPQGLGLESSYCWGYRKVKRPWPLGCALLNAKNKAFRCKIYCWAW